MYLTQQQQQQQEPTVLRSVALPLSTFDYLKAFQRDYGARNRQRLTNSEALAIILREHQQMTGIRGGRDEQGRQ